MSSVFEEARQYITKSFIEVEFGTPGAYWEGNNFFTLNPLRNDRTIHSFSIREDGKWYDFADDSKGDVFDLLAHRTGRTPVEAAREITGKTYTPPTVKYPVREMQNRSPKPDWMPFSKEMKPRFSIQPDYLTLYYDYNGNPMFYVARYNMDGGEKDIFPIYYSGKRPDGRGGEEEVWRKGLPPSLDYRPILPFDRDKPVVIVEGEKCYHEASKLESLKQYSFTTWHGGRGSVERVNVSPLAGCKVVIWPDNDDPGKVCKDFLLEKLRGVAQEVRIVEIPEGSPKGWDIADCIKANGKPELHLETAVIHKYQKEGEVESVGVPADRNFTDLGNAERLVDMYGRNIKYNIEKKVWMFWDGIRWDDNDQSKITPIIKHVVRSIANDGTLAAVAFSKACESKSSINNMLELAAREPDMAIHETDLDPDPYKFACANGVVDLKTGKLLESKREYMISKASKIEYEDGGDCPLFKKFLNDIFLGHQETIDFMRRWFGYCMTGDTSAQSFVIFYGIGANGKSTLVELIAKIMGPYSKAAPPDTFIQKPQNGIPNDIAALRGARMVLTTETEANARLAETRIKNMTGGDIVSARFMRGEFFEFLPAWKIIISTNHRPRIIGADYGIWRRIILIPFNFFASGDKADPNLSQKLWAERGAILAWMAQGAKEWYEGGGGRKGLKVPGEILNETQEYRADEDLVGRFIDQCCVINRGEDGGPVPTTESTYIFDAFRSWADREGEEFAAKMTQTAFGRAMRERGYEGIRNRYGRKAYQGISLKTQV